MPTFWSRFTRRLGAPALLLALLLSGCNNQPDPHILTLWCGWGGTELQTLRRVIKAFEVEFPEDVVQVLPIPFDQLKNKYERAASTGEGPDMIVSSTDWFSDFVQAGLVAPLNAIAPPGFWDRFHPFALAPLRAGGKVYAVPESYEVVALYFNRKLLPAPAADTDAWVKQAAGLTKGERFGLVFNTGAYFSAGFLFGFGGRVLDDKGGYDLDTPQAAAWLGFLKQLRDTKEIIARNDYGKADALFKSGKAAMILNGPWALADYQKAMGADLGVAVLPRVTSTGRPVAPFIGVKNFMVNANSDEVHQRLALKFAEFSTRPAAQTMFMEGAGHIPASRLVPLQAGQPVAVFAAQARVGTPLPTTAAMSLAWDPLDKLIEQVLSGAQPAAKALQDTQRLLEAKLKAGGA